MKTQISNNPAVEAGTYISQKVASQSDKNILLLLSGGSALALINHIDVSQFGPHVTLGLTDDRFTTDARGNTFALIQKSSFYAQLRDAGVHFINSYPKEEEGHGAYAMRIKEDVERFILNNPTGYTIGVFGIGEDGHTASIFPHAEKDFNLLYKTEDFIVPVVRSDNEFPLRITVTPLFIENNLDDVVLFAVGSNKCDNILNYMYNHTFADYQIPALIPASHPQSILFTDCDTLIP